MELLNKPCYCDDIHENCQAHKASKPTKIQQLDTFKPYTKVFSLFL